MYNPYFVFPSIFLDNVFDCHGERSEELHPCRIFSVFPEAAPDGVRARNTPANAFPPYILPSTFLTLGLPGESFDSSLDQRVP